MSKILFEQDRLTVANDHVKVGETTFYYPSISGVSIFDGKPMRGYGVYLLAMIGVMIIGGIFTTFMFGRLFGPLFNSKTIWLALAPMTSIAAAAGIWCLKYETKVLLLIVSGQEIGILKSKDRADLERAKSAIEMARTIAK